MIFNDFDYLLNDQLAVTTTTNSFRVASAILATITSTLFVYAICTITFWIITSHEVNIGIG
tara:strand:- start:84 stop:266 length:183 start_codon:yes stop_codon:yes gene_type:complete